LSTAGRSSHRSTKQGFMARDCETGLHLKKDMDALFRQSICLSPHAVANWSRPRKDNSGCRCAALAL
jgi:hypothetical protein